MRGRLFSSRLRMSSAAVLFFIAIPLHAPAADVENVISALQKNYQEAVSLSADFTREARNANLGTKSFSDGRVYFKKPGMMRWIYANPVGDEIVSNSKTVWIYQKDLAQVIETTADKGPSAFAMNFLFGIWDLKNDFGAELVKEKEDTYLINLMPKLSQPNIKRLAVEVDKTRFLAVKVNVLDFSGEETTVALKNIKLNPELKGEFFEFKAPEGVTVVRP